MLQDIAMELKRAFCACLLMVLSNAETAKKPHIVLIVGDDMGWNDLGFHGSNQIPTPNIDALGYNGIILDKFYTQQTCTPSRAALLTGNYPIRSGFQGLPVRSGEDRSLPLDMPTLPEHLKELGYHTHLVGKWHLGAGHKNDTPTFRGFDTHFGYWNGYVGYFDYVVSQEVPDNISAFSGFDLRDKLQPQWDYQGRYATDLFTEKSLEIIDKHDSEEPMFLMIGHLAAHAGKDGIELEVPDDEAAYKKFSHIKEKKRRQYAEIVSILDNSVGQVVKRLSEKNMLENSIIIFFSDNGAQTIGIYQNYGSGWPFRGLKFSLLEGGVRGSAVMYSPLLEKTGYVNKQLMHISDWLPTLYSAAGGNPEKLGNIDGINQWQVLSKNLTTSRTEILLNIDEQQNSSGILGYNGQYKLINGTFQNGVYDQYHGDDGRGPENPAYDIQGILQSPTNLAIQNISNSKKLDDSHINKTRSDVDRSGCRDKNNHPKIICTGFCLFDMVKDPCETTNVVDEEQNKDIVKNLKDRLSRFYSELVPQQNQAVDLNSNPRYFNNTWDTWLEKEMGERHSRNAKYVRGTAQLNS